MNTSLTLFNRTLKLLRYPEKLQHKSLQAWDAADEYLIDHCQAHFKPEQMHKLSIYNDDFGALCCWFAQHQPHFFTDSKVAQRACENNLKRNDIGSANVQFFNSMQQADSVGQLVLLKLPKSVALLEQQLIDLQSQVSPQTSVIAAGKVTAVQKSVLALFEKYLGPTTTSLARKKARLIFCQPTGDKQHSSPYPTCWHTSKPDFLISNLANVFARQQLDIGARFMLDNLPAKSPNHVLDLGCGNGVLGLHMLEKFPECHLTLVDESYMAVESARQNVLNNLPESIQRCQFLVSNCLDEFAQLPQHKDIDLILCNPPFHQQNTITDHIAYQMFSDSKRLLTRGGELRVVGNRHLDYPQKLKRLFGGYSVVASNRKFSILSCKKH